MKAKLPLRADPTGIGRPRAVFRQGLRDAVPFAPMIGLIYAGFGALCATNGISLATAASMSLLIYSTPLQVLLAQNPEGGLALMVPIVLAMNARFALMAATLERHFRDVPLPRLALSVTLLIPTVFTNCYTRFRTDPRAPLAYFLGIGLPLYMTSLAGTVTGHVAGAAWVTPEMIAFSNFALALLLVILAAKLWPHVFEVVAFCAGFALAPALQPVFGHYNILCAALFIGGAITLWQEVRGRR